MDVLFWIIVLETVASLKYPIYPCHVKPSESIMNGKYTLDTFVRDCRVLIISLMFSPLPNVQKLSSAVTKWMVLLLSETLRSYGPSLWCLWLQPEAPSDSGQPKLLLVAIHLELFLNLNFDLSLKWERVGTALIYKLNNLWHLNTN